MKKERRVRVWKKYKKHCAYCGKKIKYEDMQVDHIIPKRNYSFPNKIINAFKNLNPSCRRCNHYKRACSLEEFRVYLLGGLHKRLTKQYTVKIALDYGIIKLTPFSGKFYFEKIINERIKI